MTNGAKDIWLFRIVHQDTGKPAQGVPVTVLDRAGNAEGHWVSDADGTVAIPRRETARLRIRVGLRSEDPIELATATLGEGPTPLAAPTHRPPSDQSASRVSGQRATRLPRSPRPPAPPSSRKHRGTSSTSSGSSCSPSVQRRVPQQEPGPPPATAPSTSSRR